MTNTIEAIILDKENRAENFLRFTLFSQDLGLCYAMIKISKNKNTPLPDFFNLISFEANKSNQANSFFIKSINNIEAINSFAKNYKSLIECTKLAHCIIKNARHLEDFSYLYKDFLLALNAYKPQVNPQIINIKWLYKFSKIEGYAIKEDFAQNLNLEEQDVFVNIINTPSIKCEVPEKHIDNIYNKLSLWLNSNTDIIYDYS